MKEWFLRKDGIRDRCSWVMDVLFGVDMEIPCFNHDMNYNNPISDVDFRFDIQKVFNKANKKAIGFCVSWIRFVGVRIFRTIRYPYTYWRKDLW